MTPENKEELLKVIRHLRALLSYGGDIPSLTKEVLSLRLENEKLKKRLRLIKASNKDGKANSPK